MNRENFGIHQENLEGPRQKLHNLEQTGLFVFHGSSEPNLLELHPRQATTIINAQRVNDGDPAVVATERCDIAIFRALTKNARRSNFGIHNGEMYFKVDESSYNDLKDSKACSYVYVFKKEGFNVWNEMESRSLEPVKPDQVIQVTFDDLPTNIRLMPEDWALRK